MDFYLFGNIPQSIVSLIAPFILIIVGALVEKNFVGRIATFTNAIAVNLAFYGKDFASLGILQWPLTIYLDIGLIMGVIAIIAYEEGASLSSVFYMLSWAYCSIVVGIITLLSMIVPYPMTLILPLPS